MQFTIKKEQTGLHNYLSNTQCPIATAFLNAGYTNMNVGGYNPQLGYAKVLSNGEEIARISESITNLAYEIADKKQDHDITFELDL
jgi:hypothetical protein